MFSYISIHHLGRSQDGRADESEAKARTDCIEPNQSKECSVATKVQQKIAQQSSTAASGNQKLRQGQHHQKNTILRRKVSLTKQKAPIKSDATPKPPQQVINRARGTLHGLSTIKRHGNVRVT